MNISNLSLSPVWIKKGFPPFSSFGYELDRILTEFEREYEAVVQLFSGVFFISF